MGKKVLSKMTLLGIALSTLLWGYSIPTLAEQLEAKAVRVISAKAQLKAILAGKQRDEENRARDRYRHPMETLEFFDVRPTQTVVEIWPSDGWYTEILAPYLRERGMYYAAGFDETSPHASQWHHESARDFRVKLKQFPDFYSRVKLTSLEPPFLMSIAPAGSADRVVTFRNVHNWLKTENAEHVFAAFFIALKPGGILGVVEHRAKPGTSLATMIKTGYVTEAEVKQLAEQAGFKFLAKSEINANPKDSTQHPNGVWSLPPMLRGGDQTAKQFEAIGESDRMTLKFLKPSK